MIHKKSFEEFTENHITGSDYQEYFETLDDDEQGDYHKAVFEGDMLVQTRYRNEMWQRFYDRYAAIDSIDYPDMFYNDEDYQ